jgi:hypothetical protein
MTVLLIIINVFIFFKEIFLGSALNNFIYKFAVIPADYLYSNGGQPYGFIQKNITLVSALFLHGGWFHLIGNMWYLWIFGDNVEERLGHLRFLFFYILCGVIGNLAHIFMNVNSKMPTLGASGCVAGVLGAYFLMFPGARIVTLLPVFIFWTVAEVPAFFFLGIWFLFQFCNGFLLLPSSRGITGIAWWAHIGGFIAGIVLTFIFASRIPKRKRRYVRWP